MSEALTLTTDFRPWESFATWDDIGLWGRVTGDQWSTPASWADLPNWLGATLATSFWYYDAPIDLGQAMNVYAMVDVETDDEALVQLRFGADGVDWTAWGSPNLPINGRWVQVRVRINSAEPPEPPTLHDLVVVIVAKPIDKTLAAVDTANITGADRFDTGDVRIRVAGFTAITNAIVTLAPGSAQSYQLVDKLAEGPRLKLLDASGAPCEGVFDLYLRGY